MSILQKVVTLHLLRNIKEKVEFSILIIFLTFIHSILESGELKKGDTIELYPSYTGTGSTSYTIYNEKTSSFFMGKLIRRN